MILGKLGIALLSGASKLGSVFLTGTTKWIVIGVAAVAFVAAIYFSGYKAATAKYEARRLEELQAWVEYQDRIEQENDELSRRLAESLSEERERTRVEIREVIRYVESNPDLAACELDAAGLRIWNGETDQD